MPIRTAELNDVPGPRLGARECAGRGWRALLRAAAASPYFLAHYLGRATGCTITGMTKP